MKTFLILALVSAGTVLPANGDSEKDREKVEKASAHLQKLTVHRKSVFTRLLNHGTAAQLKALPGIGDASAQRIIDGRPYKTSAHVVLIQGVGDKTFAKMVKAMR